MRPWRILGYELLVIGFGSLHARAGHGQFPVPMEASVLYVKYKAHDLDVVDGCFFL